MVDAHASKNVQEPPEMFVTLSFQQFLPEEEGHHLYALSNHVIG